jgi:hypothetical protein
MFRSMNSANWMVSPARDQSTRGGERGVKKSRLFLVLFGEYGYEGVDVDEPDSPE